ncbi:MAG: hypothetical protein DRP35_04945 [Candidatus Zixiibacteriota bacterium]|nr:MAG: hypothetical protein DRP35_04945 [candidate division Zixibacteria bacterium]
MSDISLKTMPFVENTSQLENLKGTKANSIKGEKARLQKATKEFESMVFNEMLKTMRKTIPESSLSEGVPFSGGYGKDIFTQMFDSHLSKKVSDDGNGSISKMLYNQLERIIEAEYEEKSNVSILNNLNDSKRTPIKLHQKNFIESPRKFQALPKTDKVKEFYELDNLKNKSETDPILRQFGSIIEEAGKKHEIDSSLIASIIKVESNGDRKAMSPAGAKGLMQLIDSTASELKVQNIFNPRENIMAGTKYLKEQINRFGDLKLALAAYNAGPSNVEKYDGIPPFKETIAYINKVMENINHFEAIKTKGQ